MNRGQVNPDLDELKLLKKVFRESQSLLEKGIIHELFGLVASSCPKDSYGEFISGSVFLRKNFNLVVW